MKSPKDITTGSSFETDSCSSSLELITPIKVSKSFSKISEIVKLVYKTNCFTSAKNSPLAFLAVIVLFFRQFPQFQEWYL